MKRVIAGGLARSLAHPRIERLTQWLAFVLNREVDQRGCAAERCRTRAGFKVVGTCRTPEGHVEMGMDVDSAGHNEFARRVQYLGRVLRRKIRSHGDDLAVRNGNVCRIGIGCSYHGTVFNDRVETHGSLRRWRAPLPGSRKEFYATLPHFSFSRHVRH